MIRSKIAAARRHQHHRRRCPLPLCSVLSVMSQTLAQRHRARQRRSRTIQAWHELGIVADCGPLFALFARLETSTRWTSRPAQKPTNDRVLHLVSLTFRRRPTLIFGGMPNLQAGASLWMLFADIEVSVKEKSAVP